MPLQVKFVLDFAHDSLSSDSIGWQICTRAVEVDAAVLFLASHRRGTLRKWLVGSVADYCLENATCAVCVVE